MTNKIFLVTTPLQRSLPHKVEVLEPPLQLHSMVSAWLFTSNLLLKLLT